MTETNFFRIETNGTKFRVARLYRHVPAVTQSQPGEIKWWNVFGSALVAARAGTPPSPPPHDEWRPVSSKQSGVFSAMLVASFFGTEKKFETWYSFKTEKQARAFIVRMYGETANIEEPSWRPL